ncbi:hypothetical protein [Novosphingobium aquimarinum]|uniref:hypothetical protein n=1 Tax=Novosphingobium aquimarinum TaxID=2682494 RepID=UPI0012EC386C|nr:hypothetical protein [Novosphingobium aquimarinum]
MRPSYDPESLRGASIVIGTPMYDGRCHSAFLHGMCQLTALCNQHGVSLQVCFPCGDALITTARNTLCDRFLQSAAQHLVMIDSDIGFEAADVFDLLAIQRRDGSDNPYDVLAAPYPLKRLDWNSIARAVELGLAAQDPAQLERFASDIGLHLARGGSFALGSPVEVTQAGTGFVSIRRRTLERFREAFPERRYKAGANDRAEGSSPVITQFFETATQGGTETLEADLRAFLESHPEAGPTQVLAFLEERRQAISTYVSEDYHFCRQVRSIGLQVWTCPWINLTHTGSVTFRSQLSELARVRGAINGPADA